MVSTVLLCGSLILPLSLFAFDLDQCIARGLEFNPQIKAYRLGIAEADEAINEAVGAFLPTLSAGYTEAVLDNSSDAENDNDFLSQKSRNFNLRLTQPIFTGFAGVAGYKRARHSKIYREYELRYMQQQLVREIKVNYFEILRARQLVEKWQESVGRLENQRKIAEAWVAQKLASRLRVFEIDVELSNARQRSANAQAALEIAEAKMKEWIAFPSEDSLKIDAAELFAVEFGCEGVQQCIELGLIERPEIELTKQNIQIARQDAISIMARNMPQASIEGSWTDYRREYDNSIIPSDERDYYTLSINLSIRPFQGGRNIFSWRKQQLAIQQLEQNLISRRNEITTEISTRYAQIREARSRLANSSDALNEAREAYRFAEQATKLGVSSLNDLLAAELRLSQAEINRIEAKSALQTAESLLQFAIGAKF